MVMTRVKKELSGWGNYPVSVCYVTRPERIGELGPAKKTTIARGLGRTYGDASINASSDVILMERLNRFVSFEPDTGLLTAEAGVTVGEILSLFIPKGWMMPVVPGTKQATLGGCVAVDVHGRNHFTQGSFGSIVRELVIVLADGSSRRTSPIKDPELFWATVGGLGLTGIITEVTIQMKPIQTAYLLVRHRSASHIEEVLEKVYQESERGRYCSAWIDCFSSKGLMGKGVVMSASFADVEDLPKVLRRPLSAEGRLKFQVPFSIPTKLLSPFAVKTFNSVYYWLQSAKTTPFIVDYDRYFFPSDAIGSWNRLYGREGFIHYEFVLPSKCAQEATLMLLQEFVKNRHCPFYATLSRFGPQGDGLLSFPTEGYSLSLDMPMTTDLLSFLDNLDEMVLRLEGRVCLATDARMKSTLFQAMYPRYSQWRHVKSAVDPQGCFSSSLSRRLGLGGEL